MKKKLLAIVLCFCLALMCAFSLSACGDIEFRVTFIVDGAIYDTVSTNGNENIQMPEAPTKDGCTFEGWYLDKDVWEQPFTSESLANETLTLNLKVYAKWKSNTPEYNVPSEGLAYTLSPDGKSYSVSGIGTCTDTVLVIPDTYNDKPVTSIGSNAFRDATSFSSVIMPDSITNIGESAFNSSALTSVTIGSNVTTIGDSAFTYCFWLTSITIPENVTSIGNLAFNNCPRLVEIINKSSLNIKKGETDNGCVGLSALCVHNGTSKIVNKNGYQFITDDEGINYLIGCIGYTGMNKTSLVLPQNYNNQSYKINSYAFLLSHQLTSVTISDGVTSIGGGAFYMCYKLVEVVNNSSLDIEKGAGGPGDVAYYALYVHSGESKIVNKNDYLFISDDDGTNYLLGYAGTDTELTLPQDYNGKSYAICKRAFSGSTTPTSVTIPYSVTNIGEDAFENCTGLTSAYYTGTIDQWAEIEFSNSYSNPLRHAKNLYINNELVTEANITTATKINKYAFYNCNSLTSVTIGNNVTSIGSDAFYGCTNLTYNTYNNAKYLANGDNPYFALIEAASTDITTCEIHENCKIIAGSAFGSCLNLTCITIPDSVTSIGEGAFEGCEALSSVTIGNGVTSIGDLAFSACWSLTSVIIPNNVTSIGHLAFYFAGLESITIGNGVTNIGDAAFAICYNLQKVYYKGTSSEWDEISIGSSSSELTSATRYYYSESNPFEGENAVTEGNYWHYDESGNVVEW